MQLTEDAASVDQARAEVQFSSIRSGQSSGFLPPANCMGSCCISHFFLQLKKSLGLHHE